MTPAEAKAIALDYGTGKAPATIRMRRALLFYTLRRLASMCRPTRVPPHERHIVLVNCAEIESLGSRPAFT